MVEQNLNNYGEADYKSQGNFSQISLNCDNSISQATHSITSDSDYSSQNSLNYQTQAQDINSTDSESNLNNGVVYKKQEMVNTSYNQFNPRYAMNQYQQQNLIQPKYYRNPYLGENLWGINDLFRGDEFKKQITQDYLNETKTDVDFIERLQNLQKNTEQSNIGTEKHLFDYDQKSMKTDYAYDNRNMNFCDYFNSDDDLEKKFENSDSKDSKKRAKKKFLSENQKDDKYWCRRIKNNVAAKKSRDARRMKESQIAKNASYLETENENLKTKVEDLRKENEKLQIKIRYYEKNYYRKVTADLSDNYSVMTG